MQSLIVKTMHAVMGTWGGWRQTRVAYHTGNVHGFAGPLAPNVIPVSEAGVSHYSSAHPREHCFRLVTVNR
ncbi:hypothetical protein RRG08_032639 [Elysia crispata]|uniref:Uncharacterized protein n=1 Tax=Elysia crispata TaxID=231223 RepID=A0AAE1CQ89_9GAST|nr:hypothetical protein RRG08_032639 [Elysia crispata]